MSKISRLADRLETVTGLAGNVLSGNVRATLETNIAPAMEVYGGPDGTGGGLASLLGVRGGIVIRDAGGAEIARFGDPVRFEPLRALLILAGVVSLVLLVRRVLR